jgi:protein-tyrosine phosphatase
VGPRVAGPAGIDITRQSARQVEPEDFSSFDLLLAMDRSNLADLRARAPEAAHDRIHLFLDYCSGLPRDVPDPYYGGPDGFENVYRMIRKASEALLSRL